MLCIYANNNNVISSHIMTNEGTRIVSTDTLKILGFHFSNEPNANLHVSKVIDRLYSKLWTLRFLKKSGMNRSNMLGIYKHVLRPSAKYSNIVYHSLIPEYISDRLEAVQKQAMKIIYGWEYPYQKLLDDGVIEPLKERRIEAMKKFANKVADSPRFGPDWLKLNTVEERAVRTTTRNKYLEGKVRTERDKNNPLHVLTKRS